MITVACVRTGTKYGIEYVEKLRNMVDRNLPVEHRFICLTDDEDAVLDGVTNELIDGHTMPGWWAKMALFNPDIRGPGRCIYLDLDTVIVGDLTPLAEYDGPFAICQNFTQLAGKTDWPCRYGSCAMSFPEDWGEDIWNAFWYDRFSIMGSCVRGDQQATERLYPDATFLQDVMPGGFFLNKRNLFEYPDGAPASTAIVTFGGKVRPDNCGVPWVLEAWA